MKHCFAAIVALLVLCGLAMGQDKPPQYKVKRGNVDVKLPGYSLAEVRDAILQAFAMMGWKVLDIEESPWLTNATADLPTDFDPAKRPHAHIGAAMAMGDVELMGFWYLGQTGKAKIPQAEAEAFYAKFFTHLMEALAK